MSTALWAPLLALGLVQAAPQVHTDFAGGSARVEKIDAEARRIALSPGGDLKRGWVCWWYCKIDGLTPGEEWTIDIGGGVWATPDRAAVSTDDKTWDHTAPGTRDGKRIAYRVTPQTKTLWIAWGPPFVLRHAQELAKELSAKHPFVKSVELCKSKEGRPVPALVIDDSDGSAKERPTLWVQARQHAWESGSSWVGRGFVEWIVSDDPRAQALRKQVTIVVVLIMDVDNVETGNGGKNQQPHDHNRDWSEDPVHPEVRAATAWIRRIGRNGGLVLFLDLHNPAANDRQPFFFTPAPERLAPEGRENQERFLAAAVREINGPLKLAAKPRESGKGYDPNWEKISTNWVQQTLRGPVVAVCLETSWNTPFSVTENYLRVGQQLAQAAARYVADR